MNQRKIALISVAILILAIAGYYAWLRFERPAQVAQVQQAAQPATLGKAQQTGPAPEFEAATTAGHFDLAEVKKPVFLEVFATWCPHCQRETAVLNKLYAAYGKKVAFVAVSGSDSAMDGDSPASAADVLKFATIFNVKYPIAYDGRLAVADLYLQGGYPTIAVIDAKKTVSYINSGELPYDTLAAEIQKVLK